MTIVVVGAGIAGLAAARRLSRAGQVVVLEGAGQVGGKLRSLDLEGVHLDAGAESVLARRPEATELIDDLGLTADRAHPTPARPALLIDGVPHPLPPSVVGVPSDLDALAGILSVEGLVRARAERPGEPFDGDVAIGALVDQRLGPEVTDRLLEPMLGGVYAGRARELSFEAVSTGLFERVRGGGSLIAHAAAANTRGSSGRSEPVFAGLRGGINRLAVAAAADLEASGVEIRIRATVTGLASSADGYRLQLADGDHLAADAVVLACPARPTARLLSGLPGLRDIAAEWAEIPYASMAVVTLVVRGLTGDASGLLVPPAHATARGLPTIKALTYSSRKWAWVAEAAQQRWDGDTQVLRASVGRIGEESLLQLPDEALLQRTYAEACTLPGWERARLVTGHVTRWGGALPQYLVGHRRLVERLRAALASRPGLAGCGAAYDGVGIAACLASAANAATTIEEGIR